MDDFEFMSICFAIIAVVSLVVNVLYGRLFDNMYKTCSQYKSMLVRSIGQSHTLIEKIEQERQTTQGGRK